MFQIDGMTEMTEKDASEVVGGALIIVVCISKDGGNDAALIYPQMPFFPVM